MFKKIILGCIALSILLYTPVFALFPESGVGFPVWVGGEDYPYKLIAARTLKDTGEIYHVHAFESMYPLVSMDRPSNSLVTFDTEISSTIYSHVKNDTNGLTWRPYTTVSSGNVSYQPYQGGPRECYVKIIFCNYDLYDTDGNLVYSAGASSGVDYFVKFLSPREGFQDNSELFTFLVQYQIPWLEGMEIEDCKIQVQGGDVNYDYGTTNPIQSHEFDVYDDKAVGLLRFMRGALVGNNEISVTVSVPDLDFSKTATINVVRLGGFVDADGDGIDDRTGRTDNNKSEIERDYGAGFNERQMPVRSDYPEGILGDVQFGFAWLTWFLTYPFYAIGGVLSSFSKSISELFANFDEFIVPLQKLVAWMPKSLIALVVSVFALTIVKFVFRR